MLNSPVIRIALVMLTALAALPVHAAEVSALWVGDFLGVVSGGLQQGGRHMGLVDLGFDTELPVAGRSATFHATVEHIYNGGFSAEYAGDMQTLSNIDADPGTRLLEAWVDFAANERWGVRFGQYNLNSEFDATPAASLFMASAQGIGTDIAQSGAAGPSIFPETALGLRVQRNLAHASYLRAAVLDMSSSASRRGSDLPFSDGPLLIAEYGHVPAEGLRWKVGAWAYGDQLATIADATRREREYGVYAQVDHDFNRVATYLRAGAANPDVERTAVFVAGGIVAPEGLSSRLDDTAGISFAYAHNGAPFKRSLRAAGDDVSAGELAIELAWRVQITDQISLQPDVQYIIDPDSRNQVQDALVIGLRVAVNLSRTLGDAPRADEEKSVPTEALAACPRGPDGC
jgi:porin